MAVVIRRIAAGRAFRIYAFGDQDDCPLADFLARLGRDDEAERDKILALIGRIAESGVPRNEQKCRVFRELDVFELKTTGGVRVFAFYDKGRVIVCSHGFLKKSQKTPKNELNRAVAIRAEYLKAAAQGRVTVEE
jgi:phage-related protein